MGWWPGGRTVCSNFVMISCVGAGPGLVGSSGGTLSTASLARPAVHRTCRSAARIQQFHILTRAAAQLPSRPAAAPTQTLLTHSTSSQPADALSNYRTFFQLQQKRDGQNRLFIWTEIRISPGVLHSAACSIQLYNIPHSEKPPSNAGVLSFSQLLPAASQSHSHFTA